MTTGFYLNVTTWLFPYDVHLLIRLPTQAAFTQPVLCVSEGPGNWDRETSRGSELTVSERKQVKIQTLCATSATEAEEEKKRPHVSEVAAPVCVPISRAWRP